MHKWLELSIPAKQPIVDAKEKNPKYYDKIKGNKRLFRGGKKEMKWLTSDETVKKQYCQQCQQFCWPISFFKSQSFYEDCFDFH